MRKNPLRHIMLLLCMFCFPLVVCAQDQTPRDFSEWLTSKAKAMATDEIKKRVSLRDSVKQSETPSISSNTTSLVDKSSASDLFGVAMNLAGLTTDSKEMDATSMSATVSAYALKAALENRNPLDPAYYNAHRDARKLSFTLGFDYPEDKVGDINERATIVGIKYTPYDKRDASDPGNASIIKEVSDKLTVVGRTLSVVTRDIQNYLLPSLRGRGVDVPERNFDANRKFFGTNWMTTYDTILTQEEKDEIDNIIARHLDVFVEFNDLALEKAEEIRSKPQIAISGLTKQRREMRPDEHMLEAIFTLGITSRWNFVANGSFNYVDNKLSEDSKGGRVALDLQIQLTRDKLEGRTPIYLSFSGDGCWMTDATPAYRAQAKLSIPLFEGVEIPLSVSYASRTDLINEADVRGKFGFTFDIARIAQAFAGGLLNKK
jgi:hypothetical protein